jgi:hypothetical protein
MALYSKRNGSASGFAAGRGDHYPGRRFGADAHEDGGKDRLHKAVRGIRAGKPAGSLAEAVVPAGGPGIHESDVFHP